MKIGLCVGALVCAHPLILGVALTGQETPKTVAAGQPKAPEPKAPAASSTAPLTAKEQRDAQIEADTERLYKLARELKVEMDKSTKDTLSISVIRKATEVEQLARTLKERLKTPQ